MSTENSQLKTLMDLVGRSQLAQRGLTFGGLRDLWRALGYKETLSFDDYYKRYLRNGIAYRVVTAMPEATWRDIPVVRLVDEDPETPSEFTKAFDKLQRRLRLCYHLKRLDSLSGIGSYGCLLVGVKAASQLQSPLPKDCMKNADDIIFLTPLTEKNCSIKAVEDNIHSELFGRPKEYEADLQGDLSKTNSVQSALLSQQKIHASRIIHVAEQVQEDIFHGLPRMEKVWNYLDDLDKVTGGSAEAIWKNVDRGMQFDVDKDATLGEDDAKKLSEEINSWVHGLQKFIRTKGIKTTAFNAEMVDPKNPIMSYIGLISGSTGIPQRILLGSEVGQLASTQDDKNFNARIRERQANYAEPVILRPIIDMFQQYGALPEGDYVVEWPDLSTLTDRERADVAARLAQTEKSTGRKLLTTAEARRIFFNLRGPVPKELEEQDLEMAENGPENPKNLPKSDEESDDAKQN